MPSLADVQPLVAQLPPDLCAACVGRAFARTEPAPSNADRGLRLRPEARGPSDACPLCEGVPARVDTYADLCVQAARDHEFESFLVGSVLFKEIRVREDALYEELATRHPELRRPAATEGAAAPAFLLGEYLKGEINREVGKRVAERTGRAVEFNRPQITFQVDTRLDHVTIRVASLFLQGRYRKHDRELPQTRWPCRFCGGMGCRACRFVGWKYAESVEQLIGGPFVEAAGAQDTALHGMGREDVDARMLGNGRPFVLELKSPRRRTVDIGELAAEVARRSGGRVEALEMRLADAATPQRFKDAEPDKVYRARCRAETSVADDTLIKTVSSLGGLLLEQRTPERVSHRRADLVRKRRIHAARLLAHEGDRFELEIHAQSGTYIKEFVSGDEGRTRPSLAERLGVPVRVTELDVIDVQWKDPHGPPQQRPPQQEPPNPQANAP